MKTAAASRIGQKSTNSTPKGGPDGGRPQATSLRRAFGASAVALSAAVVSSATLTGCNTVQGLGEDISSVGKASEKAISGDDDDEERPKKRGWNF